MIEVRRAGRVDGRPALPFDSERYAAMNQVAAFLPDACA
jgi:hypothetical protein